jgi:hypothetical protein
VFFESTLVMFSVLRKAKKKFREEKSDNISKAKKPMICQKCQKVLGRQPYKCLK